MGNEIREDVIVDFLKPAVKAEVCCSCLVKRIEVHRVCFSVTNVTDVVTSDTEGSSCRNSFAGCSFEKYLHEAQPMRERPCGSTTYESLVHSKHL